MCRIVGWWNLSREKKAENQPPTAQMSKLLSALAHGGPDGEGSYFSPATDFALGHRRLSIMDLSDAGRQPMQWRQWQICFNGEIYNFKAIRQELQAAGYEFRTDTDTEILLKGFELWGMDALLARCRGMFAFALWDEQQQELYLVRDRLGVKPLFFYHKAGLFAWASELKPLMLLPDFDKSISATALNLYLQLGYIPQPHCIFSHAQKIEAGTYIRINAQKRIETTVYWSAEDAYKSPKIDLPNNEIDLQNTVEASLSDAFGLRMVADVEVGAFLSGGIDSSLVVALLQKQQRENEGQPLQTFTMGFEDPAYNEAEQARAIAKHLGTLHNEITCTEADFFNLLPRLAKIYDEPFGDSSAVPTFLIAQLAKTKVKVSLSADGGDELFGGYTKYEATQRFAQGIGRYPKFVRSAGAGLLNLFSPQWLERNSRFIPVLGRYKNLNHKLPKLVQALKSDNIQDFFTAASTYATPQLIQQLIRPEAYEKQNLLLPNIDIAPQKLLGYLGLCDMKTYLEGDIMTKVDRATMHNALEGREPFLDHKLVELALALDDYSKLKKEGKKYNSKDVLRQILYKYVPKNLLDRPKQGFAVPIEKWLRHALRPQLLALAEDSDFFDKIPLQQTQIQLLIQNFLSQKLWVNPHLIWFIFSLWQWKNAYLSGSKS
jgi:asparagine synthase (glutamine-hydrolysing)